MLPERFEPCFDHTGFGLRRERGNQDERKMGVLGEMTVRIEVAQRDRYFGGDGGARKQRKGSTNRPPTSPDRLQPSHTIKHRARFIPIPFHLSFLDGMEESCC